MRILDMGTVEGEDREEGWIAVIILGLCVTSGSSKDERSEEVSASATSDISVL
jgi:hypothetical protein